MKNREKYREEIIKAIKSHETCEFMNDTVIPEFIGSKTDSKCICEMGDCRACLIRFTLWLDEEYEESSKPKVDWSNVPVDTLVRVRNSEDDKWLLRYFHIYCEDAVALKYNRKYKTFDRGTTSITCMYPDESWQYCELVEDEDNGSN